MPFGEGTCPSAQHWAVGNAKPPDTQSAWHVPSGAACIPCDWHNLPSGVGMQIITPPSFGSGAFAQPCGQVVVVAKGDCAMHPSSDPGLGWGLAGVPLRH
jgi:hypothetical protein